MKGLESRVRDALVNIQHFLDANSAVLGPVNTSGAKQDLDGAAAALSGNAVSQGEHTTAATGETRKERSIRVSIRRQYLRPIAQVAATRSPDVPQLGTLRLPSVKLRGASFVDAANAVANNAEPYAAVLVAAGLKLDFLAELRGKLQEIETSRGERVDHVRVRKSSTIALAAAAKNGARWGDRAAHSGQCAVACGMEIGEARGEEARFGAVGWRERGCRCALIGGAPQPFRAGRRVSGRTPARYTAPDPWSPPRRIHAGEAGMRRSAHTRRLLRSDRSSSA
jgi:hypothetical protein